MMNQPSKQEDQIIGAKGGGSQHTPVETNDSLRSNALARILDLVSEGEIVGLVDGAKSIFLDETPLANADGSLNFKNVQVDFRSGTQDQAYIPGFPDVTSELIVGVELKSDAPWTRNFTNAALSAVHVRLSVAGLSKANQTNGDVNGYRIDYAIDLSVDGGPFIQVMANAFNGKTTSKYERTHRINLPFAETNWTLRVRRLTPNANSQTVADITRVESFAEIIDAKLRYPNSAVVGIQLDAEQFPNIPTRSYDLFGRIIRVPTNYDAVTRAYTGIWDGTFKPAYSNNPAWVLYDLLLHTRYGLGNLLNEGIPDKWALYKIARYCDALVEDGNGGHEPRFCCDLYLQQRVDAYKAIQDLSSIFRGISYWAAGSIVTSADQPGDPVYLYNASNVVEGKFTYQGSARKDRHTVALVSWNDMTDFCRAKVEYVEGDPASIERYGIQPIEVTAVGCTSRSQARRLGKWILLTERYETDTIAFAVGLDGSIAAPGQLIAVADELRAGKRIGGRLISGTLTSLRVDVLPEMVVGDKISVIMPDATVQSRVVSQILPVNREIRVLQPFTQFPQPQSAWMVESDNLQAQHYRVISVTEGEGMTFNIAALKHADGKFDEIEKGIKYEEPNTSGLPDKVQAAPESVTVTSREVAGEVNTLTVVNVSWPSAPGAVNYKVECRQGEGAWQSMGKTSSLSFDVYGVVPGLFAARVSAISGMGVYSNPTQSPDFTVIDQTTPSGVVVELQQNAAQIQDDLAAEATLRVQADANEALLRAQALADESAARAAAVLTLAQSVQAEALARADAILNSQLTVNAAIDAEKNVRQSADESLAEAISSIVAGTGEQFDSQRVWYFDSTLEGWSGTPAPTVEGGFLRPADSATAPTIQSPVGVSTNGDTYKYIKARLARTGNPVWKGEIRYRLLGDAAGAWRGPIVCAEPAWELSGDGTLDQKDLTWSGNIDQIKLDLTTAQSPTNNFKMDWFAIGRPAPGASTAALQTEALARITGDAAEATERQTLGAQMRGNYDGTDVAAVTQGLLYSEKTARATADGALSLQLTTLGVNVDNTQAALVSEMIVRANKDSVLATAFNSLTGRIIDAENNTATFSGAIDALEVRVDAAEGNATTSSTKISQLESGLLTAAGERLATSNALGTLTTRVGTAEGVLDVQSGQLLSLNSAINGKASSAALDAVTTRVTNSENAITTQANRVTSLSSVVDDKASSTALTSVSTRVTANADGLLAQSGQLSTLNSNIAGKADSTIVSALTTRVGYAEGSITSHTESLTTLSGTVGSHTGSISTLLSVTNGLQTKASLTLNSNGYVTGWTLNNNGSSGNMVIVADNFQIIAPNGGARTEFSGGNWRVYDAGGALRIRFGVW